MRPLAEMPAHTARAITCVLTDIDDTLTDDGRLGATAYAALERLLLAGITVIPVTGRPAGWCDHIARMWPVSAVVGENGAFTFRYDHQQKRMIRRYAKDDAQRAADRQRLAALRDTILAAVPGAGLSADQNYREADLAIDFREDVPPLPASDVERIKTLFEQAGATAKISSIHVNGWFGSWDKLSMTRTLLAEAFQTDVDTQAETITFVGDSPNDAPMFDHFPHSVGVANVQDFLTQIPTLPTWITPARGGAGFTQLADHLLAARAAAGL